MTYEALKTRAEAALHEAMQAFAYTEISNLFAAFTWHIAGAAEQQAFDQLWSKREDIAYVADNQGYRGREAVHAWLVERPQAMRQEKLPLLAQALPGRVENSPEYLGAGDLELHTLTTPYIRIANDLQTAKGAWWSPGLVSETDTQGQTRPYVRTIHYACDFIFEDDAWKIWHLREFPEFSYPLAAGTGDMTGKEAKFGAALELHRRQAAGAPQANLTAPEDGPYTASRTPRLLPDLLPAYDTWTDSMSCLNAPEGGADHV